MQIRMTAISRFAAVHCFVRSIKNEPMLYGFVFFVRFIHRQMRKRL